MKFDYITIVHVDGREGDYENGQRVILKSLQELPGSKGLLLTPSRPTKLHKDIEHQEIPKLSYQEYSLFIIYALHQFIKTEYAIIVQEDGWVLNGDAWRDEFANYDFIGAPIHLARVTNQNGESQVYQGFGWTQFLGSEEFKIENVFNGGFSLRSKKFLEAPARFRIPYVIPAPIGLGKFPKVLKWEDEGNQEDAQIFLYMREALEKVGVKFANIDVAKHFSFEHLTAKIHDDVDVNQIFGHHASLRHLHEEDTIRYPISFKDVSNIYGEDRVIDAFSRKGYSFKFEA